MRLRVIFILLVLFALYIFAEETDRYVLQEDFKDNTNGWKESDDSSKRVSIVNDNCIFENKTDYTSQSNVIAIPVDTSRNFLIEAVIKKISGDNTTNISLLFGRLDNENQYEFYYRGDGYFGITRKESNQEISLCNCTESIHIKRENDSTNKLTVKKQSDRLYFYVNDNYVGDYIFQEFAGDFIGFGLAGSQKIETNSLYISYLTDFDKYFAKETILNEDYSDNENNWYLADDNNKLFSIENDSYVFEHRREDSSWNRTRKIHINTSRDFMIETTIKKISGINNNRICLIFGKRDYNNQFEFYYNGNGSFGIAKDENGVETKYWNWTKSDFINKDNGATNKLTFKKVENKSYYYINDNLLAEIPFEDFFGHHMGFKLNNNQKIAIQNLEIKYLDQEKVYTEFPIQEFPPDLCIENLIFTDTSGNYALDGMETGNIEFEVVNRGRGNAYKMDIDVTPITSVKNMTFTSKSSIRKIASKAKEKILIPVKADIDVQTMIREFRIEVTEVNGFDADPAKISFETLAFAAPELRIEQIAIDDKEDAAGEGFSYGNGNSIIEPNESIEVSAFIQNYGEGAAIDVKAEVVLTSDNNDITYPYTGRIFNLGDIKSGDFSKVDFYFYTNKRFDQKHIPLSINLTESTGMFSNTIDLGLKLGDISQNMVDVEISQVQPHRNTNNYRRESVVFLSDVDKDIPKTGIDGKNTLAIIIGIEEYKYAPDVDYASRDAQTFYKYAANVFGIPERNIYYRINDGATSGEFNKIFAEDGWIARRLKKNQTDVIIYYSGHGAPDTKSRKGYLIPYDIDPNYANTGVSIESVYSSLSRLEANSVTLFIDACFSGESRSEEMLIAGVRPIALQIKNPVLISDNIAVLSASQDDQYSSSYPDMQHGLFTYFLLRGIKGHAKGNDNILKLDELYEYVKVNVQDTAGFLDKEQTPTFLGKNTDRIILKYQ